MKDDLLIKFIDGRCTRNEEDLVIGELSQEGTDASEWVQMATAARLAGTQPYQTAEGAEEYVSAVIARSTKLASRKRILKLSAFVGGLCAVAASVAVFFVYQGHNMTDPTPGGTLANVQDSIQTPVVRDSAFQSPAQGKLPEQERPAAKASPLMAESGEQQSAVATPESVPELIPSVEYSRNASKSEVSDTSAVADASKAAQTTSAGQPTAADGNAPSDKPAAQTPDRQLRMTRPAKSPYRVKVKDLSKDFVFEWSIEGKPSRASLVVKDSNGLTLVDRTLEAPATNAFPVSVMDLTDKGELTWTLVLEFPDSATVSRTGRLEMKSEID